MDAAINAHTIGLLQELLASLNSSSLGPVEKVAQRFMKDSTQAK